MNNVNLYDSISHLIDDEDISMAQLILESEKSTEIYPETQPLLSNRELELLNLIAQGLSNQDISDTLNLALSTVKGHIRNIQKNAGTETY